MRFTLIPGAPFSNVAGDPDRFTVHPMRGSTPNVRLAARFSGQAAQTLEAMSIGAMLPTRHGIIRRDA